ncbi:hypothetical protein UFOVP667_1 [uncultured Caudovirales phage]|uniref:Uncharacterized protein n=1 Tax=uncultured Caudovirales phage TaxID=2100421 RepID=A0A6J5N933_9CAUD|nr:hypothetical protein UFOVP667_1 [uncultured Caudovirales phage]
MTEAIAENQSALLDLDGRELNQFWVDEKAPLFVANNPLHWKAHKLQVALERMEKQQRSNPAQFNATVYFATIDKLGDLMGEINKGVTDAKILDKRELEGHGDASTASTDSEIQPISMDS